MGTSVGVAPHGDSRDDRKTATVAVTTLGAATVAAATVEWVYRR
jgi:hypothetical protein